MKVEELEKFGATLEMPKEAVKEQGKIMLQALRKRFGIVGMLGIFKDTWTHERRLRRDHPETRRKAAAISPIIERELFTFSAMFLALAKRLGREEAYEFFKTRVMNEIAQTSMGHIYQLEDLKECEGDTFENFKKFNIALFQRTTRDGTWHMASFTDDPDKLTINVTTCANVELFGELGVPEMGKFGCDHDLAGFPVIEDDADCEFRRLCTIAKGDDSCVFEFYRKGTAPDNAHLNK
jgi:hypothetical protein